MFMHLAHLYITQQLVEREPDTLFRQLSEYDELGEWLLTLIPLPRVSRASLKVSYGYQYHMWIRLSLIDGFRDCIRLLKEIL